MFPAPRLRHRPGGYYNKPSAAQPIRLSLCSLLLFLLPPPLTFTAATGSIGGPCSQITNPDCRCLNSSRSTSSSSSSSSSLPSVVCNFTHSQPPSPIFGNESVTKPVSLGTLDLSHNDLESLPSPDFFRGIHTIHRLDLSSNLFTQVPHALTTTLEGALIVLDLSKNRVDRVALATLANIPGLERLDLSRNYLKVLSDDGKSTTKDLQFQSLRTLNLSRNAIQSINGDVFSSMPHLVGLDLSHNQLAHVTEAMFSPLMLSLNRLDLGHNHLRSIQPMGVRHLQHLRDLSLAQNPLQEDGLKGVLFPSHLRSVDLSHCTLTIIDHCQLTTLPDLGFIGLRGNDLTCTCQLYLLLQWYQDQHHKYGTDSSSSDAGSNWTCTRTPSSPLPITTSTTTPPSSDLSSTTTRHDDHATSDETDSPDSSDSGGGADVLYVRDLRGCGDTESHCRTLEHAQHHLNGSSQLVVTLDVASSDNQLMASWTLEDNRPPQAASPPVDGFQLHYLPEDGKPINSPLITLEMRSFVLHPQELEKHYTVCLDVLAFQNALLHQVCRSFRDESLNVIVGALAGAVFITPLMVILMCVYLKDRSIRKRLGSHHTAEKLVEVEEGGLCGDPCARKSGSSKAEDAVDLTKKDQLSMNETTSGATLTDSSPQAEDTIDLAKKNEECLSTNQAAMGGTNVAAHSEKQSMEPASQHSINLQPQQHRAATSQDSAKDASTTVTVHSTTLDSPSTTQDAKRNNETTTRQASTDPQPHGRGPTHERAATHPAGGATLDEKPTDGRCETGGGETTMNAQAGAQSSAAVKERSNGPAWDTGVNNHAYVQEHDSHSEESTDF